MGLRSDLQTRASWRRSGQTPVVVGIGRRFGCTMISALTNRGISSFRVIDRSFTAPVYLDLLKRLVRHTRRKVLLVVDRLRENYAKNVRERVEAQSTQIRLCYLTPYRPQLNPNEVLN